MYTVYIYILYIYTIYMFSQLSQLLPLHASVLALTTPTSASHTYPAPLNSFT